MIDAVTDYLYLTLSLSDMFLQVFFIKPIIRSVFMMRKWHGGQLAGSLMQWPLRQLLLIVRHAKFTSEDSSR